MDVPQFIAGRFRIECEIGNGGMGTVYRATHLGLHRRVAVKIIKAEHLNDSDVADRFMREARTMAKLRHPHAAIIFDAGSLPDGRHFIVMEYIEGITLSEALARDGRFSPERAVEIAIQICDVLEEAHQLGIIHRDLKPANIMLNDRGICVLDFGVAKVLASSTDSTASQASTGSGQIIGTPRYMSPEQCLGQKVGVRSDLYSLGVVLYEMLAGRPPFIDPVPSVVMVKQATEAPPPLPRLRQDIPRALSLTVHTLLAKRSEDRPQTAATARKLLERSLVRVAPVEVSIEPLPSAVAAAGGSRGLMFRYGAPIFLVSILGALLLALAYGGPAAETASKSNALNDLANRSTAVISSSNSPATNEISSPTSTAAKPRPANLSLDQAKSIVAARTDELMSDLVVAQTAKGAAILGIQEAAGSKLTGFFMMERRGPAFHVTARGLLDSTTFQARRWMAETVSAKDDGRNQVLFSGINSSRSPMLKLVLFDPDKRQAYSLSLETDSRTGQTRRMQWSDNTADSRVAAYRVLLRDKARTIIGRGLKGI
jgi:serine/threonine protein kinase